MASTHHRLDYTEFAVTDLDRATAFYRDAFGWGFNAYGPGYAGIRADPAEAYPEVGGFRVDDEVAQGGPLCILYSADLGASETSVLTAGGTIVEPAYDFPGGRRFHFRDPEGNVLAVWSAS
ncbi:MULTISPECIES: VOC family protein [unclassified Amycolatopsis]|uniref:VOC family protein n=1 Tax=unclassified Amycolatopsis TaxID=2618356 RepID=UPI003454ADEF